MKRIFLISLFLVSALGNLLSQDYDEPLLTNEFGFNSTALVSNLLSFNQNTSIGSIDQLLYFKTGKRFIFRSAINFDAGKNTQGNNENTNSMFLVKLGFEKKKRLSKSWVFHSGLDFFGGRTTAKTETIDSFFGGFSSEESNTRLGLAGVYGVQWLINDRLALGTEGYLVVSANETKTLTVNQGQEFSNTMDGYNISLQLPTSLLLSIYF